MNISMAWIVASVIVSGIGFVLLNYGRKLGRPPHAVAGLLMLVYPYFVPSVLPMAIVAAALLLLLWLAVRLGW
jgi:lipopolysaccharide export LptBFGC system permease protein LptF